MNPLSFYTSSFVLHSSCIIDQWAPHLSDFVSLSFRSLADVPLFSTLDCPSTKPFNQAPSHSIIISALSTPNPLPSSHSHPCIIQPPFHMHGYGKSPEEDAQLTLSACVSHLWVSEQHWETGPLPGGPSNHGSGAKAGERLDIAASRDMCGCTIFSIIEKCIKNVWIAVNPWSSLSTLNIILNIRSHFSTGKYTSLSQNTHVRPTNAFFHSDCC